MELATFRSGLNARSLALVEALLARADERAVAHVEAEGGGRVIDCGIKARGGLIAGVDLARICMADLGEVSIVPGEVAGRPCPLVQVVTDQPVTACLASQYAGWQLAEGKFFAMGSGPMRAAYGHEPIYDKIGTAEVATAVVGVLEGRKLPPPEIVAKVADACRVEPSRVTLLIAPTASLAGGVQVVARSLETALHKLAELSFDLSRIVSAHGSAPLPPVAKDDLSAIGRTNDAILYGARVTLYVTGDDESLVDVGPEVPAASSRDYGEPFAAIFARYDHDFYAVDPQLFSPAELVFQNIETGRAHAFGSRAPGVLARSFFGG
jgi:methenyltetrahydromethanopterin cyclohydrolase